MKQEDIEQNSITDVNQQVETLPAVTDVNKDIAHLQDLVLELQNSIYELRSQTYAKSEIDTMINMDREGGVTKDDIYPKTELYQKNEVNAMLTDKADTAYVEEQIATVLKTTCVDEIALRLTPQEWALTNGQLEKIVTVPGLCSDGCSHVIAPKPQDASAMKEYLDCGIVALAISQKDRLRFRADYIPQRTIEVCVLQFKNTAAERI